MAKINFQKLQNHIGTRWVNGCPMCNGREWTIHPNLQTYTPIDENNVLQIGGGDVFPVVLVKCNNCGFVAHVSAVLTNVLE